MSDAFIGAASMAAIAGIVCALLLLDIAKREARRTPSLASFYRMAALAYLVALVAALVRLASEAIQ